MPENSRAESPPEGRPQLREKGNVAMASGNDPADRRSAIVLPVSQAVGSPDDKSEASGYEYRGSQLTVGEEQQACPVERTGASRHGEHPAEHLGKRDLPMHVWAGYRETRGHPMRNAGMTTVPE